jgi:muramoyltetrapeptide carboxypeptidase
MSRRAQDKAVLTQPPRLKPGATIGIVAPAGPFDSEKFLQGTQVLGDMGFKVVIPDGLFEASGYLAGSDGHRAAMVDRLFGDKSIDAIICARGGFGSIRILPLLNYEAIAKNPKIFIGFSDISALLSVLQTRCELVTLHGPVVTSLADASEETKHSLLTALTTGSPLDIKLNGGCSLHPGSASGLVCGGNLTTLCHLVGTPYTPFFKDCILFLEDVGEAPYRIDRMLVQMKLAGCFEGLAGIILGSFESCGSLDETRQIVRATFESQRIPILAGLEAGHGKNNMTLPMGIEATLDADHHRLLFHRPATL